MRVVSLVPAATELLCAAGGLDLLVGRSHECDWPRSVDGVPSLTRGRTPCAPPRETDAHVRSIMEDTGTLHELDADLLHRLKPDLLLVQDTCSVCSIDRASIDRALVDLPVAPEVLTLRPDRFEDVLDDLLRIGEAIGRQDAAQRAMVDLRARWWDTCDVVNPYVDGPATLVLEWSDPLWAAGHWTPQIIEAAGGRQSLVAAGDPSRMIEPEECLAMQVERLVIAPCGVPLDDAQPHLDALQSASWWPLLPAVIDGSVAIIDGTGTFSRPGPRLVSTLQWLTGWLQDRPDLMPPGIRWRAVSSR